MVKTKFNTKTEICHREKTTTKTNILLLKSANLVNKEFYK